MKSLPKFTLLSLLLSVFFIFSCVKEPLTDPASEPAAETAPEISHLPPGVEGKYYTATLVDFATERSANWVSIPGGSVDALEAAIDGANPGAVIYLKSGTHTLNSRLTITKPIKIIGEEGAELLVTSNSEGTVVDPGIHFLDAPHSLVQNVEITALGEDTGWNAILFENSPYSGLLQSTFNGFRMAVIIDYSDYLAIIGNTFMNPVERGILLTNGESSYVGNNHFEGANRHGIWACDKWGTLEHNSFTSNRTGAFLCKYPASAGITKPNGNILAAEFTNTGWKVRNNLFESNIRFGINVRDATHWAFIGESNEFESNGIYDILIPPDVTNGTNFIPAAYDNTIHATPDVMIKDCGINTTVVGGTLADTNVDPC